MDEESSNSSFNDQENDENLVDKENRGARDFDDNETDDQQRYIYEQQQYQRSQYYQQEQAVQAAYHESNLNEDDNQSLVESGSEQMDFDDKSNSSPKPVPDYLIEKIDNEKWPGVNGIYDSNNEWKGWEEISIHNNDYSNELVIILPYVTSQIGDFVSLDIGC